MKRCRNFWITLVSGCSGRDLSEVIWDIAGQRLNGTPDKGYGELLFSRGTEEYRLTVQLIDSGREQGCAGNHCYTPKERGHGKTEFGTGTFFKSAEV